MDQQRIDVVGLRSVGNQLRDVGRCSPPDDCGSVHGHCHGDQPASSLVGFNDQLAGSGGFGVQGRQRHEHDCETSYSIEPRHCYYLLMEHAGFVLAGGRSSRMGRDKALLPWNVGTTGGTLLDHVAAVVREAVGNVTVIGRDAHPDVVPDCGPLGGLLTAFSLSTCGRVLLVACDMPNLTAELLRGMIAVPGDAVVAESAGHLHPLCAVYHRRLQPQVALAVQQRSLKMHDFLATLPLQRYLVQDVSLLKNLNTPEDFAA